MYIGVRDIYSGKSGEKREFKLIEKMIWNIEKFSDFIHIHFDY